MMDFDEQYAFTRDTWRRARKQHACGACGEAIELGDRYWHFVGGSSDGVDQAKQCVRCHEIYEHLQDLADDQMQGPDLQLNCGHGYQDLHGVAPPEEIAALAFATRAEMQALLTARKQATQ